MYYWCNRSIENLGFRLNAKQFAGYAVQGAVMTSAQDLKLLKGLEYVKGAP
jgi:hypothetical protein